MWLPLKLTSLLIRWRTFDRLRQSPLLRHIYILLLLPKLNISGRLLPGLARLLPGTTKPRRTSTLKQKLAGLEQLRPQRPSKGPQPGLLPILLGLLFLGTLAAVKQVLIVPPYAKPPLHPVATWAIKAPSVAEAQSQEELRGAAISRLPVRPAVVTPVRPIKHRWPTPLIKADRAPTPPNGRKPLKGHTKQPGAKSRPHSLNPRAVVPHRVPRSWSLKQQVLALGLRRNSFATPRAPSRAAEALVPPENS